MDAIQNMILKHKEREILILKKIKQLEQTLYEVRAMMVSVRPYLIHIPDEQRADFDGVSEKVREVLKA